MIKAPDILKEAARILEERGKLRDKPDGERSMSRAVAAYQALRGEAMGSELDGWLFLCVLKLARATAGQGHIDDYQDLAGYAALAGECLSNNPGPTNFLGIPKPITTLSTERWIYVRRGYKATVQSRHGCGVGDWFNPKNSFDLDQNCSLLVQLRSGDIIKGRGGEFQWEERGDANDIIAYQYVDEE